jgi:hypothetical protein
MSRAIPSLYHLKQVALDDLFRRSRIQNKHNNVLQLRRGREFTLGQPHKQILILLRKQELVFSQLIRFERHQLLLGEWHQQQIKFQHPAPAVPGKTLYIFNRKFHRYLSLIFGGDQGSPIICNMTPQF